MATDIHSFAERGEARVRHLDLNLELDFEQRIIRGAARLELAAPARLLVLDTRDLEIQSVEGAAAWKLGAAEPFLGTPLEIELAEGAQEVSIRYQTSPQATALQWCDPPQTAGKMAPFLYSQSQAIHARSWIPCQDSPGLRASYEARISAPAGLTPLMAALPAGPGRFRMPWPVPPYLIALACGRLDFAATGPRSGVWAEPETLAAAAREFEDMEAMLAAAERLYGPYRWERYDVLVMPPSFPYGGMENPCLTFATPTVLAGDKSLVSLISHELAHSWSGNLVTNATWRDFWLNEGFTTYIERRLQEEIYGERRARLEAALEYGELQAEFARLPERDHHLAIDLAGRDPDDGATLVPYFKGALLLRRLEQLHGRERFDRFLRAWFDGHAFQSATTEEFAAFCARELGPYPLENWTAAPRLPDDCPKPDFEFEPEPRASWSTQEWLHWLRALPDGADCAALDGRWHFTQAGNAEILALWLKVSVRRGYAPGLDRLEEFLARVGRRKFVRPIFEALKETPAGLDRARALFDRCAPNWHPITRATIAALLA